MGSKETTYTYDDLGQLKSSVNGNTTWSYTYDNAGNVTAITKKTLNEDAGITPMPLAIDTPLLPPPLYFTDTDTLAYTDSEWGDLLTSFNGHAITYDGIGNPLSYYNGSAYTFTWTGRQLTGAVKGSKTMSFTYDDNGIRTSKTVNGVTHTYQLNGSQVVSESWGDKLIVYLYDSAGSPIGMMYRTTSYDINDWDIFWFEKNLQGDIVAIYNETGTKVVSYNYTDAWGNYSVSYTNGGGSTGAQYNPFRYRGYYYDTDLGMYYLQSRYYDPNTCRFINADSQLNNSVGILGANLFAYCINDPVNMVDYLGDKPGDLFGSADEAAIDFAEYINENSIKCNSEYAAYIYKVYVCNKTYKTIIFTLLGKEIELTILVDVDILTYYTYSQVIKGGKDNVIAPMVAYAFVPNKAALLHTHGAYLAGYDNDSFSNPDKWVSRFYNIPMYVATPIGNLRRYDPKTQEDVCIFTNCPYDSNHPLR